MSKTSTSQGSTGQSSTKTSPKPSKAKAAARQIAAAVAAEVFAPAAQPETTSKAGQQKSAPTPDGKTTAELVKAVRDYALTWYHDGGWDLVVECWSDEEIEAAIQGAKTDRGAIRKVWAAIKPLHAHRSEIQTA